MSVDIWCGFGYKLITVFNITGKRFCNGYFAAASFGGDMAFYTDLRDEGLATRAETGSARMPNARPSWQDFSRRYPKDRDCLASFLVLELAEVLQEAKPANLVCVANKRRSCGRNLYLLWKAHGPDLIAECGLRFRVLADRGDSLLLLLYSPKALESLLSQKSVRVILGKAGYPPSEHYEEVLAELERRSCGEAFPHEIGVFLGYPLKDVVGFMGWAPLSFTCQGPWKIFGAPEKSLRLAEDHRRCRCYMSSRLASGCSPIECLRRVGERVPAAPVF